MTPRWRLAAAGILVAALLLAWPAASPVLREVALDLEEGLAYLARSAGSGPPPGPHAR